MYEWALLALYPEILNLARQAVSDFWPKIYSETDAYLILNEEKAKLGIHDPVILRRNSMSKSEAYSGKNRKGGFIIGYKPILFTRINMRHELYHIKNDALGYAGNNAQEYNSLPHASTEKLSMRKIKYLFIEEPRANLYSLTGLRL